MAGHETALRLYAILDAEACALRQLPLLDVARAFRAAGVQLLQYRDKTAVLAVLRANAVALRALFPPGECFLVLNDHPQVAAECGFDGAHVGQSDASVDDARARLGPDRILGLSTHTMDQIVAASQQDVDYVAIGPVFATASKADAESPVGLSGVQAARAVVRGPLIAIGGIAASQCRDVLQSGADAVALISALLSDDPHRTTREIRELFRRP